MKLHNYRMLFRINLLVALISLYFIVPVAESIAVMSIDLGSEWIKTAIVKPGVPMEVILNKESRRKTPVVVSMKGDERLFGDPAMNVAVRTPDKAYLYVPLLLGKKFEHPNVELYKKRFPHYKLVKDESRGTVLFQSSSDQRFSCEELIAMILNNSRIAAENFAEHPMKDVVITVPVYYNQAERKTLVNVAKMVGLNVLQLINDNTAVALHYGIFRSASFNETERRVMFYNMGASSTSVTIVGYKTVKSKDRGYLETVPQLEVKGVGFDPTLGGLDMEIRLRDHLAVIFQKQNKAKGDVRDSPRSMMKLLKEAKRVKQVLSANTDHYAQIEGLYNDQDFKTKVTRNDFENMCSDLFDRVAGPVNNALKSASMKMDDIEMVILMGGGTRVRKVQEMLLKAVGKNELGKYINTDEAAALGAVYKATDLTQGFKVKRFIIKDMNIFPIDVSFHRKTSDENGQPSTKIVTRTLFHNHNPVPQKKVMTFNKQPRNFPFNVSYGDTSSLNPELLRFLHLGKISNIELSGVDDAHSNNKEAQPKGVKAFFNMDESFILNIEKIEAHFETMAGDPKEEEQSAFAKLGSTLSKLFGSGKEQTPKNAEPKKEEQKQEEKLEEKKDDANKTATKATGNDTVNAKNATTNATEANATISKEPPKPILVKENIQSTWSSLDIPNLSAESFEASVKLLNKFQILDEEKHAKEKAKNSLESFLFDFREKLYSPDIEKLSKEAERNTISEALSAVSNWLDDEGYDANADLYKKKLKGLKDVTENLRFRLSESQNRPKAIVQLLSSLNLSTVFMKQVNKMPESKEIYTEKDLKDLQKVNEDSLGWLMSNWKIQNATDPTVKPVLLVKDIVSYQGKVDRELFYLINKAKYYVPKPKPKVNATDDKPSKKNNDKANSKDDSKTPKNESKVGEEEKTTVKDETLEKGDSQHSEEKPSVKTSKENGSVKKEDTSKTQEAQKESAKKEDILKAQDTQKESVEKEDTSKEQEAQTDSKINDSDDKGHGEL